jgi:hypothetical protein
MWNQRGKTLIENKKYCRDHVNNDPTGRSASIAGQNLKENSNGAG